MTELWQSKAVLLFSFSFAVLVVLLIYTHFAVLPVLYKPLKPRHYNNSSNHIISSIRSGSESKADVNRTSLIRSRNESMTAMNLTIMDFEDLGGNKTKIQLLVIVSTAPQRLPRREAIRETWWKHCVDSRVRCVFVTDGLIEDDAQRTRIIQERDRYKDMELQPLLGWEFGPRFLKQIQWAMAKFDFQYLLRIDDDYFLCLKRLLAELPTRPKQNLVWGSFHCLVGVTWVDEAFMIFTWDMIHRFLSQDENTMLCHAHADQQIGIWLNDISSKQFFHDSRLYETSSPASFTPGFDTLKNVCDSYLGIHGTYEKLMRYFGQNANDGVKGVSAIPEFSSFCQTEKFDWRPIGPGWHYEPKLCKDNPKWNIGKKIYVGRENKVKR